MKLDAIKHQGARTDLTSAQVGPKLTAAEKIAENSPDSKSQIKRFIRLTELIPELMDMVDEKKIALNPAYELSFLKKEEQVDLLDAMDSEQATPSLSQAQRLKKYSQEGHPVSYTHLFSVSRYCRKIVSRLMALTRDTSIPDNWMSAGIRSTPSGWCRTPSLGRSGSSIRIRPIASDSVKGSLSGWGLPRLIVRLPCGSPSISRTFFPACAKPIPSWHRLLSCQHRPSGWRWR